MRAHLGLANSALMKPLSIARDYVERAWVLLTEGLTHVLFERRLGIRTEGRVELVDLGLTADYRQPYLPSPWLSLPRVLRRSEIGPQEVFVDFGCGMGRVVLEAAMLYRFARVIGVELSDELARVARANIDRNRYRLRAGEVEIVVGDVLAYPVPDDVTVAYFFNPFYGSIFEHVVSQLLSSVDRAPRRLRIIYQNPHEESMLLATGRIRRVRSGRSLGPRRASHPGLALYEIDPA